MYASLDMTMNLTIFLPSLLFETLEPTDIVMYPSGTLIKRFIDWWIGEKWWLIIDVFSKWADDNWSQTTPKEEMG